MPLFQENPRMPTWVSPWHLGLNQGPIVLMIENYRSGLLWRLMRQCPYLVSGLPGQVSQAAGWRSMVLGIVQGLPRIVISAMATKKSSPPRREESDDRGLF